MLVVLHHACHIRLPVPQHPSSKACHYAVVSCNTNSLSHQVFEAGTAAADAGLLMLNNNSNSCINGHSCDNSSSGIYTWTCEAQSAAETAPTASAAEELGLIEVDPDEQDYNSFLDHKAADENSAPLCRFFMSSSGCRRGAACVFRHVRPPCRFFLSRSGCKYGADCRFLHHTPSSTNSSSGEVDSSSSSDSAEDQQQGLAFDWGRHTAGAAATTAAAYEAELIRNNNGGSGSQQDSSGGEGMILLLGEGDFSFTAALLKKRQAARAAAGVVAPAGQLGAGLVATSYETQGSLRKIYTGRALADRLDQLQAAGRRGVGLYCLSCTSWGSRTCCCTVATRAGSWLFQVACFQPHIRPCACIASMPAEQAASRKPC